MQKVIKVDEETHTKLKTLAAEHQVTIGEIVTHLYKCYLVLKK